MRQHDSDSGDFFRIKLKGTCELQQRIFLCPSVPFAATVVGNLPNGTAEFLDGGEGICASAVLMGTGNAKTANCATLNS